jgi:hypothetical protein
MHFAKTGSGQTSGNSETGFSQVLLDVSKMLTEDDMVSTMATHKSTAAGGGGRQEVGMFVLASPKMEEAVYIGYDGANVFVDMRNSSQNTTDFQSSFRTSNTAPFPKPSSGVLQLHVFFDQTTIELFASDCTCAKGGLSTAGCDCRNASKVALAVTGIAFPLRASATNAGLYAKCSNVATPAAAVATPAARVVGSAVGSVQVSTLAMMYGVRAAPVKCAPPTCTPPSMVK